jgi:hypothetical protein
MHRVFQVFAIALFASCAGASGAFAAPQILAVLATGEPVPLTCVKGVCEAEFSAMCLQWARAMPEPGTAYAPVDPGKISSSSSAGPTARRPASPDIGQSGSRSREPTFQ